MYMRCIHLLSYDAHIYPDTRDYDAHMGEFVVEGFFFLEVVTFFVTLRADLEDYFKCKT